MKKRTAIIGISFLLHSQLLLALSPQCREQYRDFTNTGGGTANGGAMTIRKTTITTGSGNGRLTEMLNKRIQDRANADLVSVQGLKKPFRISTAERERLELIADEQIARMVELALDSERPNALNDAAVSEVLRQIGNQDPIAMTYLNNNSLLTANETTRLAREIRSIGKKRSLEEMQREADADGTGKALGQQDGLSPEAEIVMSMDELLRVLEQNGSKSHWKIRLGNLVTGIPLLGKKLQEPVDSLVTLRDRVVEIQRSMDSAITKINQANETLRDKRDSGEVIIGELAKETYLLGKMLEKLDMATEQVREVDATAARKLEGQGRLRVASLLRAKGGLLGGIMVLNEGMTSALERNEMVMLRVDLAKMTAIPITAGTLMLRANEERSMQIMRRVEAIENFTDQQLRLMGDDMKSAAVRALALAKKSTLDASSLSEVLTTIGDIRKFTEQGNIEAAKQMVGESKEIAALLESGFGNAIRSDQHQNALPQTPELLALTQQASALATNLSGAAIRDTQIIAEAVELKKP